MCIIGDCFWRNKTWSGKLLSTSVPINSAPLCQNRCLQHISCAGWAWSGNDAVDNQRVCYLYRAERLIGLDNAPGVTAGIRICRGKWDKTECVRWVWQLC